MNQPGDRGVRTVVYSFVVADLFHYGHLQLLQTARALGDLHVCGVLTDEAAATYRSRPIANVDERVGIISNIRCVDRVMLQDSKDPTDNLRKLHQEFPAAEMVLVHGNDWKDIPGRAYVESIGGRVVQPEYYRRLSDSRIRQELAQAGAAAHYELFTEHFRVDRIVVFEEEQRQFVLSTKANTLRALRPLIHCSRIEPMLVFRVGDWTDDRKTVLARIRAEFAPARVVVRSSAMNEDTYHLSQAGCYQSRVGVPARSPRALAEAIDAVVCSYREKGNLSPLNQLLVQPHTEDVRISGVVFTRAPETSGPYYVINYDDRTRDTETVTAGTEARTVEIARGLNAARRPARGRALLKAVQEIERVIPGTPLDVEFAVDARGRVTIFQVRPLACAVAPRAAADGNASLSSVCAAYVGAARPVRHLAGSRTILSDMAFWNPAEIVGDRPNPLDISLYRDLIMDAAWHEGLAPLGYHPVAPAPLLVELGGKPYVDLRCAANALLPRGLPRALRGKLVAWYFELLARRPELHDKVEFEIIDNCFYFSLDNRLRRMRRAAFTERELATYRAGLLDVTATALAATRSIPEQVQRATTRLDANRAAFASRGTGAPACVLQRALELLRACRADGAIPFVRVARLAFIGNRLLRSAVERGWLSSREWDRFMDSVRTVATQMSEDQAALATGRLHRDEFLARYGHLRPGTYDIASPRYVDDPAYFAAGAPAGRRPPGAAFRLNPRSIAAINAAMRREGLKGDTSLLIEFARAAIEARERIKFEFTKNLSDAIEAIARAGAELGFSREDMAQLDVAALERAVSTSAPATRRDWAAQIAAARQRHSEHRTLSLPPLVFSVRDLEVVERPEVRPNFITQKFLRAELVTLDGAQSRPDTLRDKVVLIEKADPGFDWLFGAGIAGLITKYGGVGSHMAIRCAEFGLPAAIGCGDAIYRQLRGAAAVILDCRKGHVRPAL